METINIILPNKKRDNKGTIKNKILNEINRRYPFFDWHMDDDEPQYSVEYAGPGDMLVLGKPGICFSALNKRFWTRDTADFDLIRYGNNLVEQSKRKYNAETDLDIAMCNLREYAKAIKEYTEDKGYDFKFMGMPCRIYDHFIQIGSNIIPYDDYTTYFDHIRTEKKKEEIMNIILNISTYIHLNAA